MGEHNREVPVWYAGPERGGAAELEGRGVVY